MGLREATVNADTSLFGESVESISDGIRVDVTGFGLRRGKEVAIPLVVVIDKFVLALLVGVQAVEEADCARAVLPLLKLEVGVVGVDTDELAEVESRDLARPQPPCGECNEQEAVCGRV